MAIPFDKDKICILLFADDIVIHPENDSQLQKLLDFVNAWCSNWKIKINRDKTKIVHFRNKSVPRTKHDFNLDENNIEIVDKYKYLGIYFDEFLDFRCTACMLAGAGGRTLGSIISKFKSLKMWLLKLIPNCITVRWYQ